MQITIGFIPVGDTTQREIGILRFEVQRAVERTRGVEWTAPVRSNGPTGSKGVADDLGAFVIGLPSNVILGVFEVIKGLVMRPAQPLTKVRVTADGCELEFDPRRTTTSEMADLVERLKRVGGKDD